MWQIQNSNIIAIVKIWESSSVNIEKVQIQKLEETSFITFIQSFYETVLLTQETKLKQQYCWNQCKVHIKIVMFYQINYIHLNEGND